jgi:hypothetical protein
MDERNLVGSKLCAGFQKLMDKCLRGFGFISFPFENGQQPCPARFVPSRGGQALDEPAVKNLRREHADQSHILKFAGKTEWSIVRS